MGLFKKNNNWDNIDYDDDDDDEYFEECAVCKNGRMIPTYGNHYQCDECGAGAEEQDGLLWWNSDDLDDIDD